MGVKSPGAPQQPSRHSYGWGSEFGSGPACSDSLVRVSLEPAANPVWPLCVRCREAAARRRSKATISNRRRRCGSERLPCSSSGFCRLLEGRPGLQYYQPGVTKRERDVTEANSLNASVGKWFTSEDGPLRRNRMLGAVLRREKRSRQETRRRLQQRKPQRIAHSNRLRRRCAPRQWCEAIWAPTLTLLATFSELRNVFNTFRDLYAA